MNTKTPTLKKTLICALTDEEQRNYGIELAATLEDMEAVEAEKKKNADHYKDRLAGMQAKADELRRKVSTAQEWRDVECTVVLGQPTADRKQIIRSDTGEVVETSWMTEAEKQTELALEDGGDDGVIDVESEPVEVEGYERNEAEVERDAAEGGGDSEGGEAVIIDEASRPGPLAEAEAAGRAAFAEGKPMNKCPYSKKRVKEAQAWARGWLAAEEEAGPASNDANPMPDNDPEAPAAAAEADDY